MKSCRISCQLAALLLTGCASYTTTQTDESYGTNGPTRKITTQVSVSTFCSANSEIAKSRVTQTDKTQSSSVGAVNLQATNNAVEILQGVVELLKAAPK